MKRLFSLIVLMCTYLIPIFSQANSPIITNATYGNDIIVIDAKPFSVMNKDFEISLNSIINEKNLLVSESSEKDLYFLYWLVPKTDDNQSGESISGMKTIRIIPKNILIPVPETGSPLFIKKP